MSGTTPPWWQHLSKKDKKINDQLNFKTYGTELTYTETSWFDSEGKIVVKPKKPTQTLASSDLVLPSQPIEPTFGSSKPPLASISFFSNIPLINKSEFKKK